jgi:hypothetical protein
VLSKFISCGHLNMTDEWNNGIYSFCELYGQFKMSSEIEIVNKLIEMR